MDKFKLAEQYLGQRLFEIKKRRQRLQELFIQTSEIETMESGPERDMAILRLSIIAELDAVNLYERFAEIASNENISKVMIDIANEEKVHVGEFKALLEEVDPKYADLEEEGEEEVEEIVEED
jgi:rubrerythrin